ncbi:MAG: hypothetical protein ACKVI6_04500 [Candidatus Poseidoniales archaeon]|jgi:hypothetical protein|tara:strand:- start:5075 stop:6754 length:1680 start_codon:yes stop_codon:yes gene_type:complete
MDTILSILVIFWILIFISYILMEKGLGVFGQIVRGLTMFMLEKVLGPGADLVEGRKGSGPMVWIIQGVLWLFLSSTLTFIGLWLAHDPTALHSLEAWGYHPVSSELFYAGKFAALFGCVGMFIIGTGLHILPNLLETNLASEKNAVLTSFVWTISVIILVIGSQNHYIGPVNVILLGTGLNSVVGVAVIANQLLTKASSNVQLATPGWLIIFGLIGNPIAVISLFLSGEYDTGLGQWLVYHLIGATFFFSSIAGISLYSASFGSGNALWSQTVAGVVIFGTLITINPLGNADPTMAIDMLGLTSSDLVATHQDNVAGSFLMALAIMPIIALSSNILITLRGTDVFVENPDSAGIPEINFGAWMLLPLGIAALFIQTDTLSGTNELSGISNILDLMTIWTIFIPLTMGAALQVLPSVSGRYPLSQNRARLAFWMLSAGALLGLSLTMMSDIADSVLLEALVEEPSTLSHTLRKAGSVIFYGTVLGAIFHSTNLFSGLYRGAKVSTGLNLSETTFAPTSYPLTSTTTIRKILASGAVLDTNVVPTFESNESGSPTLIHEEE